MRIKSSYICKVSSVWHIPFSFTVLNNDNDDHRNLLHSDAKSLRVSKISFLLVALVKNNNNNNNDYYLVNCCPHDRTCSEYYM